MVLCAGQFDSSRLTLEIPGLLFIHSLKSIIDTAAGTSWGDNILCRLRVVDLGLSNRHYHHSNHSQHREHCLHGRARLCRARQQRGPAGQYDRL